MAAAAILEKFQVAISPQPDVRSTSSLVLGWGFRGRRIHWRYLRLEQIQAAILDNFEWPYLRNGSYDPLINSAHRAVIFAIAQLS